MSNLPKFTPVLPPTDVDGKVTRVAGPATRCVACDDVCWSRDAETLTCRACWRVKIYAVEAWREMAREMRGEGTPVTDLESVRVPRLANVPGCTGVVLDVELVPQGKR